MKLKSIAVLFAAGAAAAAWAAQPYPLQFSTSLPTEIFEIAVPSDVKVIVEEPSLATLWHSSSVRISLGIREHRILFKADDPVLRDIAEYLTRKIETIEKSGDLVVFRFPALSDNETDANSLWKFVPIELNREKLLNDQIADLGLLQPSRDYFSQRTTIKAFGGSLPDIQAKVAQHFRTTTSK
jgi:hypothetical protein